MKIREIWRRIASTRYTRVLEQSLAHERAQADRLRAENRALLNSILGIAGVPPIPASSAPLPRSQPASVSGPEAPASGPVPPVNVKANTSAKANVEVKPARKASSNVAPGAIAVAGPLRRRSWQQITRMLEFESAKQKSVAGD